MLAYLLNMCFGLEPLGLLGTFSVHKATMVYQQRCLICSVS